MALRTCAGPGFGIAGRHDAQDHGILIGFAERFEDRGRYWARRQGVGKIGRDGGVLHRRCTRRPNVRRPWQPPPR